MAMHYMLRQLSDGAPRAPAAGGPAAAAAAAAAAHSESVAPAAAGPAGALPASAVSAASLWRELKARLLGGRDAQKRTPGSMRSRAIAQFGQKIQNQYQYQRVRDSSLFYSSKN